MICRVLRVDTHNQTPRILRLQGAWGCGPQQLTCLAPPSTLPSPQWPCPAPGGHGTAYSYHMRQGWPAPPPQPAGRGHLVCRPAALRRPSLLIGQGSQRGLPLGQHGFGGVGDAALGHSGQGLRGAAVGRLRRRRHAAGKVAGVVLDLALVDLQKEGKRNNGVLILRGNYAGVRAASHHTGFPGCMHDHAERSPCRPPWRTWRRPRRRSAPSSSLRHTSTGRRWPRAPTRSCPCTGPACPPAAASAPPRRSPAVPGRSNTQPWTRPWREEGEQQIGVLWNYDGMALTTGKPGGRRTRCQGRAQTHGGRVDRLRAGKTRLLCLFCTIGIPLDTCCALCPRRPRRNFARSRGPPKRDRTNLADSL